MSKIGTTRPFIYQLDHLYLSRFRPQLPYSEQASGEPNSMSDLPSTLKRFLDALPDSAQQPAHCELRPVDPSTTGECRDASAATQRHPDTKKIYVAKARLPTKKRALPASVSSSEPTRRKLDHVKRKIHQAAVLELDLLDHAKALRERRALWTLQYQDLSHQMPSDFTPATLPPLFNDALISVAKVSPPATPKSSNVTERYLCPCPSPCLLDDSDEEQI